ncbi:hypothetical protein KEM54_001195 [Ascosphaera aggregata]|nr:hypothetical protein KEM54_001195 [Ascosphaera aggregata]
MPELLEVEPDFTNQVKSSRTCPNKLAGGFQKSGCGDRKNVGYCQDQNTGVIYLHTAGGHLGDMGTDCNGIERKGQPDYDGMCPASADPQPQTTRDDYLKQYGISLDKLDATRIPNTGAIDPNYYTFEPYDHGVQTLSLMAVVFGVWGDENGVDSGCSLTGEASLSLARLCYGDEINGNAIPEDDGIRYLAFPGSVVDTVPKDANWQATNYHDFENSITDFGNNLPKKYFYQ